MYSTHSIQYPTTLTHNVLVIFLILFVKPTYNTINQYHKILLNKNSFTLHPPIQFTSIIQPLIKTHSVSLLHAWNATNTLVCD